MIKTITFEGHEFEYEQREAKSYRNIKRIARAKEDPNVVFDVAESLFCGKDEEYAELLDDDFGNIHIANGSSQNFPFYGFVHAQSRIDCGYNISLELLGH